MPDDGGILDNNSMHDNDSAHDIGGVHDNDSEHGDEDVHDDGGVYYDRVRMRVMACTTMVACRTKAEYMAAMVCTMTACLNGLSRMAGVIGLMYLVISEVPTWIML